MDLIGKRVAFWLSDVGGAAFIGVKPADDPTRQWYLGGEINGETPGVGVWVTMHLLITPENQELDVQASFGLAPTLVRWEWIITASVLTNDVDYYRGRGIGFRVKGRNLNG